MSTRPTEFTGRHMLSIILAFFGVIIAVNLTMATFATTSWSGFVVKNSYVASQQFNRWLDQAEAQQALGWDAEADRLPDGRVEVAVTGPQGDVRLTGTARHPLGRQADRPLVFEPLGAGRFRSTESLPEERWILRLQVAAEGQVWRHEGPLP